MPSDGSEEVAADHSAPSTIDPVAEGSQSWADLSEVLDSTAPSGDVATAELIPVKEEEQELQEAQSLGAVL
jgi:hypothetical protein